jgi:hypothetical protein
MIETSRIPKIPAFTLPALIARVGKRACRSFRTR